MNGRQQRLFILGTSLVPPIAVLAAMVFLWGRLLRWSDVLVFAIMYVICAFGVTTGYHRLLTHGSFKTSQPIRLALTVAGAMSGQGPPITWVAHHRRHHRVADKEGDPHSPHLGDGTGLRGALKNLWHAHLGWQLDPELTSDPMRYCPDLVRERAMRRISAWFLPIVLAGVLLPGLLGLLITGTATGALTGALWGGLVRLFLVNHMAYAVNSICHYFGRRRFATIDESRNVIWLALPSFGEAWHNNHHAFPKSARHGLHWWELDPAGGLILLLERLHLARDVVRVDPRRLALRERGLSLVGESPVD
ncbi:acyl-CoA desaturase [Micromonospora sp. KC207]|uniref:acyl-CoA desaturase n=1 Tax=Micromonospora sp. KC207 TaxID=2530377 RepID=UPI00104A1490|nr:acyl-CoA desaturase [Micromonospora sp. KC207]TDC65375.1 acyl-CoA desaturase [Micromonospora sp. KC207]